MPNISIVGWYGKKNVGDEAFRIVFNKVFHDHKLEFVTPPNKCNNPDIVILGGGAVVSPFYLNDLPDCPRYAIGVDISYESEIDLLAKAKFKSIYVRNSRDLTNMKAKLDSEIHVIPDLAFLLSPSKEDVLTKYRMFPEKKSFGVFVTDYVNPAIDRPLEKTNDRANSFISEISEKLDGLSEKYEIILVPCSTAGYGDDRRINLDIAAFMKNTPTNIMDTIDPEQMIKLTSQLDVALCMRFHSHVFSVIAGTPFVSIDFTRKVRVFLEENNLTNTNVGKFDGGKFTFSELEAKIEKASVGEERSLYRKLSQGYHDRLVEAMQQVHQEISR